MLPFLFIFALSLQTKYPISRGICAANINGSSYNFLELSQNYDVIEVADDYEDDYTFYISLCQILTKGELPFNKSWKDGFSVARCSASKKDCTMIIPYSAFDYQPLNPNNFTNGLIYRGDSQPIVNTTKPSQTYVTYDVIAEFDCDPTAKAVQPPVSIDTDLDQAQGLIRLIFQTKYGCPATTPAPSPTPDFAPDCVFKFKDSDNSSFGISLNLADDNGGPGGIRYQVRAGAVDTIVYYQPCERFFCPMGATCDDSKSYSSAYVCMTNGLVLNCRTLGVATNDIDLSLKTDDIQDGVVLTHHHPTENRSISVEITCQREVPSGHILWPDTASLTDNKFVVVAKSSDVCPKDIPSPIPPQGDMCNFVATEDKSKIALNLTTFNKNGGWSKNVAVRGLLGSPNRTLIYQPCGWLDCPADTHCDGDIDATVWLCQTSYDNECIGYGLYEHNIEVDLVESPYLSSGVVARYKGDDGYVANVYYVCDDKDFSIPSEVYLKDRVLSFNVSTKNACIQGPPAPTPLPSFIPPKPQPGLTPTPTPNPKPSSIMFSTNNTHYIWFDLSAIDQTPQQEEFALRYRNQTSQIYAEYSPWTYIDCPDNFRCTFQNKYANMWICYTDRTLQNICHNTGDKAISVGLDGNGFLDDGVILRYQGIYGIDSEIRIRCQPLMSNDRIDLDEAEIVYHAGMTGPEYSFRAQSSSVCPQGYISPEEPVAPTKATPTPDPMYIPTSSAKVKIGENSIEVDLKALGVAMTNDLTIGVKPPFEKAKFVVYSPYDDTLCPYMYDCGVMKASNFWNCFKAVDGKNKCYSMGEAKYGVNITFPTDSYVGSAQIDYAGGYGGTSTRIIITCDETLTTGQLIIKSAVMQYGKTLVISAKSKKVCPKSPSMTPTATPGSTVDPSNKGSITAGSVILGVTVSGIVLYFSIGVFAVFLKTGSVGLPNSKFWSEFAACVETGAVYIFSCRTKVRPPAGNYDAL